MIPFLTAREFPAFDEQVEESIQHFTDLSIACDCAVRRLPGWSEALTLVLYKHRISIAALAGPEFDLTKDVNINDVLHKVLKTMGQILEFERRVQVARECAPGDTEMRRARIESLAEIHRFFLEHNNERIRKEILDRVLPVVKEIASAGLPAVAVAAPIYFMARAVLWRVWPEFAKQHEKSLQEQSAPLMNPTEDEWAFGGGRPNIFLDIDPKDPKHPNVRIGYMASSPRLALILGGLESWPDSSDTPRKVAAAATPARSSSMVPMLRRSLQVLQDLLLPSFARFRSSGQSDRSGGRQFWADTVAEAG